MWRNRAQNPRVETLLAILGLLDFYFFYIFVSTLVFRVTIFVSTDDDVPSRVKQLLVVPGGVLPSQQVCHSVVLTEPQHGHAEDERVGRQHGVAQRPARLHLHWKNKSVVTILLRSVVCTTHSKSIAVI